MGPVEFAMLLFFFRRQSICVKTTHRLFAMFLMSVPAILVKHAKHQGRITKRSVLKQRKEKERRKDTAMSSKLLWHLQNLGGDACAAKLFVFQP